MWPWREPRSAWVVVAIVAVNWGLATHGTYAGSGDEPHYLLVAHSMAFDADLDLANNYRDATLITAGTLQPEQHAVWHDGTLRPVHDIGMPALFAPVVAIAYRIARLSETEIPTGWLGAVRLTPALVLRHQMSLLMALVAAVLGLELFRCFEHVSPAGRPVFWALVFALSPPLLSHSFLFFTEVLSATLAFSVFRRLTFAGFRDSIHAAGFGLMAGLLFLIHVRNAGLVAGLAFLAIRAVKAHRIGPRDCAVFLVALGAGLGMRTTVNYYLWGTMLRTPLVDPGGTWQPTLVAESVFVRLTGLLLDREFGLLAYAPVYLLAGAGIFLSIRLISRLRAPTGIAEALIVIACYLVPVLLPALNAHGWMGGWSPAARFLVPVVPLVAVVAYTYANLAPRWVVWHIVGLQIAIDVFVWQYPKTLWNDGDGVSAFLPANMLPTVAHGELLCAAAWLALAGAGCAALALQASRQSSRASRLGR
jgi:hypothetical protein